MSESNEYDESSSFRDAQTAKEVRFLMRGLQQLAIDPHAEVPANFHATVMARARQMPRPRKRLWGQIGERLTIWAPVLAVGLLLSLGVNVWQGSRALAPHPPSRQTVKGPLEGHKAGLTYRTLSESVAGSWPIYEFQAQMLDTTALGSLVETRPVPQSPLPAVEFTSQAPRPTLVWMGILYADALAALRSGAAQAAEDRLHLLTNALSSIQAPPALSQYLHGTQAMLQRQRPADITVMQSVAQSVAIFERFYAQVYATAPSAAEWVLFQAGAWLENLSLAAALGDQGAVQQAQVVQSLPNTLRPFNVPSEVLDGLQQLHGVMARQPLTAEDLHAIQTLVDTIKRQLSE